MPDAPTSVPDQPALAFAGDNNGLVQEGAGAQGVVGDHNTVTFTTIQHANLTVVVPPPAAGLEAQLATLLAAQNADAERRHNEMMAILGTSARTGTAPLGGPSLPDAPTDAGTERPLHDEIDRYRVRLESGEARMALVLLEELQRRQPEASPAIRFRIVTNIGAAHLALESFDAAADAFLAAEALAPADEKAMCNVALAHILRHDLPAARTAGRTAVAAHPDSAAAWATVIATSEGDQDWADMPAALYSSIEVSYALSHVLMRRGDVGQALRWMRRTYALDPAGRDTLTVLAEMHLRTATQDGSGEDTLNITRTLTIEQHDAIVTARRLLARVWRIVRGTQLAPLHALTPLNLALIALLLGETPSAEEMLDEALTAQPDMPQAWRLRAQLALERHDGLGAEDALRHIPPDAFPDLPLMRAAALHAVEDFLANAPPAGHVARAQLLRVDLLRRTQGPAAARDALRTGIDAGCAEIVLVSELASLEHACGDAAGGRERLDAARARLTLDAPAQDVAVLAEAYRQTGHADIAADLLDALPLPAADIPPVRQLIAALVEADQRTAALRRVEALSQEVRGRPYFLRLEFYLRERLGDLPAALALLDRYLAQEPRDLGIWLNWVIVSVRAGRRDVVAAALQRRVEDELEGSPAQRAMLAQVLADHGRQERAWAVAYAARRAARGRCDTDADTHLRYIGLGLTKVDGAAQLRRDVVGLDTAFTVTSAAGTRTYIVEDRRTATSPTTNTPPETPSWRQP